MVGGWITAACLLPLAASPYVLGNAIWVMTDNLALALVAISIGIALFMRPTAGGASVSGIAMVVSVLVRQINVWPTAIAWMATILGLPRVRRWLSFRDRLDDDASPVPPVILGSGVLLAFLVLGIFIGLWGGLVPPSFQPGGEGAMIHSGGINQAVSPYAMTLFGVYALPATVLFLPLWREDDEVRRTSLRGGLIGLVIGLVLHSAPGADLGRVGGWLWTLAERCPVLGGRSMLLVGGAVLGGFTAGMFFGLLRAAGRLRAGWLMLGFAVSFLAAYTANAQAFQRYFDPPVLLALGWCLALAAGAVTAGGVLAPARIAAAGLGLATMQVVFAITTLYLKIGFMPTQP